MMTFHQTRAANASLFSDIFQQAPNPLQLETLLYNISLYNNSTARKSTALNHGITEFAEWCTLVEQLETQELQQQIERDFTRIFCLGRGSVGTTASVILSPQRLHKREPWSKVRRFYMENGWNLPKTMTLFEDSIPVEMAFYAIQIDSLEQADTEHVSRLLDVQRIFIKQHLLTWLPNFCEQLRFTATTNSVFFSLANLLRGYLQAEQRFLDHSLTDFT